ncbi:MAG: glycosyltransferase family 4 protein [Candidatus Paceibacterota bacterium]
MFKRVLLFYFKLNIKHIDGVYVYTDAAKDFLKEQLPGMEVSLLPAPVDVQVFKPNATKQFCPNGELRLLMNARFSLYKRHKDLFAALMILHRENKRVRVTCISRNEWDREQIAALAVEKGVQDMVSVLDAQPQTEMPALYYAHDVLVLPSYNEAIGMVVPEAMACGVPTITSDTVGANVYVKHGETGLIFETGNVTALADSIRRCFDTELLEKYGWNASAYIQTTFTPQMVVQRFTESLSSGSELIDDQ